MNEIDTLIKKLESKVAFLKHRMKVCEDFEWDVFYDKFDEAMICLQGLKKAKKYIDANI